jgi:hypothetical protein
MSTEAKARILIDNLLHKAGWRFFDAADSLANIRLEVHPGNMGPRTSPNDRKSF